MTHGCQCHSCIAQMIATMPEADQERVIEAMPWTVRDDLRLRVRQIGEEERSLLAAVEALSRGMFAQEAD